MPASLSCAITLPMRFLPDTATLGLPQPELKRHIAYDIGAAAVTRHLAKLLQAPAVLTHFSRLLIDPNRGEDDPTMIMRLSDGAIVPGNRHIDSQERARRVDHYYRPYHAAIDRVIDQCIGAGRPPAILSIHSFTESWKGTPRPWHAGILWDRDPRLAQPLLDHCTHKTISLSATTNPIAVISRVTRCGSMARCAVWPMLLSKSAKT